MGAPRQHHKLHTDVKTEGREQRDWSLLALPSSLGLWLFDSQASLPR